jgi:predicted ATPase/DNA-binding SARP family transcriptional activator
VSNVLVRVLGPVELERNGHTVASRSTSRRIVLAVLAANRGSVVTLDQLAEILGITHSAVRTTVSRLRSDLDKDVIVTNSFGYSINAERCDSTLAERFLRQASATSGQEALDLTEIALAWWRGMPFGDLANEWWAEAESARLAEMATTARETLADLLIEFGRSDEAVSLLLGHVIEHPLREHPRRSLMTALDRSGRATEALRQYQDYRQCLAEVGTEPSHLITALERAIATGTHPVSTGSANNTALALQKESSNATPPISIQTNGTAVLSATSGDLVGRRHDRSAVIRVLETNRLLTIIGMGGVGKTRLALAVGRDGLSTFEDGVSLVELVRCRDLPSMLSRAAGALGVPVPSSTQGLANALRGHDLLLILDNCEHMLDATRSFVSDLLARSSRLRILATSREPIGLDDEQVYRLDPLTSTKDAVEIFRRRAMNIGVDLTDADPLVMEEICRRLDRLPLAVELAAATCQLLSLEQIRDRLDGRFETLRGSPACLTCTRHETLRAVIDWSYQSLPDEQQLLLRRLSVFNGGFDIDAVEHLAEDLQTPALFMLRDLVDRSLVSVVRGRRTRYEQSETIRLYARQRSEEQGEIEDHFVLHDEWCRHHVDRMAERVSGADEATAIERVVEESSNIWAALRRLLTAGKLDEAADLVLRLESFVLRANPLADLVGPVIAAGAADGHPEQTRLLGMELVRLHSSKEAEERVAAATELVDRLREIAPQRDR